MKLSRILLIIASIALIISIFWHIREALRKQKSVNTTKQPMVYQKSTKLDLDKIYGRNPESNTRNDQRLPSINKDINIKEEARSGTCIIGFNLSLLALYFTDFFADMKRFDVDVNYDFYVGIYPEMMPVYAILRVSSSIPEKYGKVTAYHIYQRLPEIFTFSLYQQEKFGSPIFKRVEGDTSIIRWEYYKTFYGWHRIRYPYQYDINNVDMSKLGGNFEVYCRLWIDEKKINPDRLYALVAEIDIAKLEIEGLTKLMVETENGNTKVRSRILFTLKKLVDQRELFDMFRKKYTMYKHAGDVNEMLAVLNEMQIKWPRCYFSYDEMKKYYSGVGNWHETLRFYELVLDIYKSPDFDADEKAHRHDIFRSISQHRLDREQTIQWLERGIESYKRYIREGMTREDLDKIVNPEDEPEKDKYTYNSQEELNKSYERIREESVKDLEDYIKSLQEQHEKTDNPQIKQALLEQIQRLQKELESIKK